ncbi:metallophosphoesterase [Facklamia sp. 7083-14-GEN3]|uniref:metallophosphoesterase family protein n=1 Tax=Facklamia sp. 7083-14-GEN3 TaxID=2973478 RepID=UPI00215BD663|nr:metallophosphoesterase family protein [Facklamia sp. 7083-14-GEN3]MCR8968434.1 metallophosphatase family protein [Facklamia sp. 7083-14-GEN3]
MSKSIAVLTDIHGNSTALNAVLKDIDKQGNIDHIYCLGDLVAIGHETNQVLEKLISRNDISYVRGNHDEYIVNIFNGVEPGSHGEEREHHYWIAKHMDEQYLSFIEKIPKRIETTINGKKFLFVHYHLNDQYQFLSIDPEPSTTKLDSLYQDEDIDMVCFGHHHVLHHFRGKHRIYINPGALGCHSKPIANYVIINIENNGCINCLFKEIPYDNHEFLLNYYKYDVPAKESLLSIFHGNQDKKLLKNS